ncbi:hypothetical protein BKA70DRAFT_1223136 [Coprinopsis sp. MPI-PUGE-AT-0042]|nr:hypothetical protein BKA70DRAFT_1223136 [Coprinopsis sp. MPI-PUGE-AT-0042]
MIERNSQASRRLKVLDQTPELDVRFLISCLNGIAQKCIGGDSAAEGLSLFQGAHTVSINGGNFTVSIQHNYPAKNDIEAILKAIPNYRDIYSTNLSKATTGTGPSFAEWEEYGKWLVPGDTIKTMWGGCFSPTASFALPSGHFRMSAHELYENRIHPCSPKVSSTSTTAVEVYAALPANPISLSLSTFPDPNPRPPGSLEVVNHAVSLDPPCHLAPMSTPGSQANSLLISAGRAGGMGLAPPPKANHSNSNNASSIPQFPRVTTPPCTYHDGASRGDLLGFSLGFASELIVTTLDLDKAPDGIEPGLADILHKAFSYHGMMESVVAETSAKPFYQPLPCLPATLQCNNTEPVSPTGHHFSGAPQARYVDARTNQELSDGLKYLRIFATAEPMLRWKVRMIPSSSQGFNRRS